MLCAYRRVDSLSAPCYRGGLQGGTDQVTVHSRSRFAGGSTLEMA